MDKELIKKLVELAVVDKEYEEQLLRFIEAEDWNSVRLMIESLVEKYDISDSITNSTQLMKVKIQLYKITQNLYSEFMNLYTEYLDSKVDEEKASAD